MVTLYSAVQIFLFDQYGHYSLIIILCGMFYVIFGLPRIQDSQWITLYFVLMLFMLTITFGVDYSERDERRTRRLVKTFSDSVHDREKEEQVLGLAKRDHHDHHQQLHCIAGLLCGFGNHTKYATQMHNSIKFIPLYLFIHKNVEGF